MAHPPKKTFLGNLVNRCICMIVCLLVLAIIAGALVWYFIFYQQQEPDPVASCADCHCIVNGSSAEWPQCPESVPRTNFSQAEIETWNSQTVLNAYRLDCNPYDDEELEETDVVDDVVPCRTEPAQNEALLSLGEMAVCAVHFQYGPLICDERENDVASDSYRLKTYASREEAEAAGGFVTHAGHCGVCSTLQDLAAYAKSSDLTTEGKFCAKQGVVSFDVGVDCFIELGMTVDCAAIWSYNARNTAQECFSECLLVEGSKTFFISDEPNNGPAPECALNDCLQCDEEASGELFRRIAGRTRRRSGLLSSIAHPCDQLVDIEQETCPETSALDDEW